MFQTVPIPRAGSIRRYKRGVPEAMVEVGMSIAHLPACRRLLVGTNQFESINPGFALLWEGDYRSRPNGYDPAGWTKDIGEAMRYHTKQQVIQEGKRLAKELI